MQHFSNPVIAMKGSSFEQFLVLKKNVLFFSIIIILPYMGMTVNGAWPFEQTLCFNSRIDMTLGGSWPNDFWGESL